MADPIPDPDLEGADSRPNRTLQVLGYVLLVAAAGPLLGAFLMRVLGESNVVFGIGVVLTLLCVLVLPLVCLGLAIVAYTRGQKEAGLGYLLGTFAAPIVGFGSCFVSLSAAGM